MNCGCYCIVFLWFYYNIVPNQTTLIEFYKLSNKTEVSLLELKLILKADLLVKGNLSNLASVQILQIKIFNIKHFVVAYQKNNKWYLFDPNLLKWSIPIKLYQPFISDVSLIVKKD